MGLLDSAIDTASDFLNGIFGSTTWRDEIRPASFRGIPFSVVSSDASFGRRIKIYEFIKKEATYIYDMGSAADDFALECYVIQNTDNDFNYFKNRDALIQACKQKGPGTLIHPYYGELNVRVNGKIKVKEAFKEGGIARITITFVNEGATKYPGKTSNHNFAVDQSAFDAMNESLENFGNALNTAGSFIENTIDSITNSIQRTITSIRSIKNAFSNIVSGTVDSLNTLIDTLGVAGKTACELGNIISDSGDAYAQISGLGSSISGLLTSGECGNVTGSPDTTEEAETLNGKYIPENMGTSIIQSGLSAINYTIDDLGVISEEQENNVALAIVTNKTNTLAQLTRVGIRVEFSSREVALTNMELIAEGLDDLLYDIVDPKLFSKVQDMRAVFIKSMLEKSAGLVRTVEYKVPVGVQSTLELAYNKYKDVGRCAEIRNRNILTIKHPGFMPNDDLINILEK